MNVHKNIVDLRTNPFQEVGNDGRRPRRSQRHQHTSRYWQL